MSQELDYSVRVSGRAQHARIIVHPGGAIEVVLPKGVSHHQVPAMLQARRGWLESAVLRMREVAPPQADLAPPVEIDLPFAGRRYRLDYHCRPGSRFLIKEEGDRLRLSGPVHDLDAVNRRLREWLKSEGRVHLPELLAETAARMEASYRDVTIRLQKTRWGSCSVRGNISLNARLLLLPMPLLRYVLVHELAHLAHHNHSPAFWRHVEKFTPDYRRLRQELIEAGRQMPGWVRN